MNLPALLSWFDRHEAAHFCLAATALGIAAAAAWRSRRREADPATPVSDWTWAVAIFGVLLAGRWPTLIVNREFNVDESHLLVGARTLWHDPVAWRSVDGATAGPLDFVFLWPAGLLTGWDGFLPARLTAILLLGLATLLLHQCLAAVAGRTIARFASLPVLALPSLTGSVDLLHFSTELPSIGLLAAAAYAALRRWLGGGGPGWNALGAFLLGAVPLAKLQGAPLAAAMGLAWLIAEWRSADSQRARRCGWLIGAAVLPLGLVAMQTVIAGVWHDALVSYIMQNFHYAGATPEPLAAVVAAARAKSVEEDSLLHLWLPAMVLGSLALLAAGCPATPRLRLFSGIALAACLIAIGCVLAPRRPFLHYWQYLIAPLGLLWGVAMAATLARRGPGPWCWRRTLVLACALGVMAPVLSHRARRPIPLVGALAYLHAHPLTEPGQRLRQHARPGDTLAVWGWSAHLFVEAGLRTAARSPQVPHCLEPGPYREYFRTRFLADVVGARPRLFVDTIGPASLFYQDRARFGHERNFPELAAFIRTEYVRVHDGPDIRIYRRRSP